MTSGSHAVRSSSQPTPPSRSLLRNRVLLILAVCGLTLAVVVTTTRLTAPARAATAHDTTWSPGDVSWKLLSDGRCETTQFVQVAASSAEVLSQEMSAIKDLGTYSNYDSSTHIQDTRMQMLAVSDTSFSMQLIAHLPGIDCDSGTAPAPQPAEGAAYSPGRATHGQLAIPAGYLPATVSGSAVQFAVAPAAERGVVVAAVPTWLKGAIGAVVGAAVYVGVSLAITAGITATGVMVGASTATVAAITAMAGCIGGATSTAATLAIGGGDTSWKATLTNAVTGCITGAVIGSLSLAQRGAAVGNAIRGFFGAAPIDTIGQAAADAASQASLSELSFITATENLAADTAIAVQ